MSWLVVVGVGWLDEGRKGRRGRRSEVLEDSLVVGSSWKQYRERDGGGRRVEPSIVVLAGVGVDGL